MTYFLLPTMLYCVLAINTRLDGRSNDKRGILVAFFAVMTQTGAESEAKKALAPRLWAALEA